MTKNHKMIRLLPIISPLIANMNIPYQFLLMLLYLIPIFALIRLAGKSTPPKPLGIPYFKYFKG